MKIGCTPLSWIKLNASGVQPSNYIYKNLIVSRSNTILNFSETQDLLFVYGGKNEFVEGGYLNDLFVFHLDTLIWE